MLVVVDGGVGAREEEPVVAVLPLHHVGGFAVLAANFHDPAVIAYLLRPNLYDGREVNVTIETQSPLTIGMSVVDWWGVTRRKPNVRFMNSVDADRFYDLLVEKLARLP